MCEGDLETNPDAVAVQSTTEPMPEPQGGIINDGIYDLVSQIEYVAFSTSAKFDRGAMRFTEGATRVEHVYEPVYGSQADAESPHRLMTSYVSGSRVSFSVTCPQGPAVFDPEYSRGFTAQGTALWLFQSDLLEIYELRH